MNVHYSMYHVGSNNKYKECSVDRRLVNDTSYHIISGAMHSQ